MNFLAIDDEPLCLDDLRFALEDAAPGCTCACFSSPSRALEQARTEPFDAAFLDIEMGGANGLALAKQLKDLQPDLHIIFVTGYEKYAVSAFAIHASGYLLKPVDSGDRSLMPSFALITINSVEPNATSSSPRISTKAVLPFSRQGVILAMIVSPLRNLEPPENTAFSVSGILLVKG